MNRIFEMLKKYMIFIAILTGISIVLGMSYSNFIVASEDHKVAEMYIGTLKYSMTIDGSTTNTLSVPAGETIVDITITNENPIDTYYKLIYQNNSNVTITYYEGYELDDLNNISKTYNKANDKITINDTNLLKLIITNNSTSAQNISFKIVGGFATNTLNDVIVPTGYTAIEKDNSANTNTYFCTTTDTLTQGLLYTNGQYTYAYKQESNLNRQTGKYIWGNIDTNGWGMMLKDKESTSDVTSKLCTYINNKPIVSMSHAFIYSNATKIDLSSFNTSNVISMSNMFVGINAATLNVNSFNTNKLNDTSYMFASNKIETLDLSSFDTSNVTNMEGMFNGSLVETLDLSNFNTSKVTNMRYMFGNTALTNINLSSFDTSNVTSMSNMFYKSQATTLDLNGFNTSKVTDMSNMFEGTALTNIDLSSLDTSKVTDMSFMFSNSQATTLDLSNFDTSNVITMQQMFHGSKATSIDLSNFDTSKVTNMNSMFWNSQATTIDLSSFDTSKVKGMVRMFCNTTNLKTIYVSNKFSTESVTSSTNMFLNSTNLVGGSGTTYNSSYVDKTYARIDGGTSSPGYFTSIPEPNSFSTDSWMTIAKAVKSGNISKYNVGDTKSVTLTTYGTHTLRIANTSTPSECSTSGFSQSACGFVVEFADIITTHNMNGSSTNKGGWPASDEMYTFVNNDIYNALPNELRNVIIDTTVVSSHGSEDTANFTSTDKLYLLAPGEVWSDWKTSGVASYDTARDLIRTLDYYTVQGVTTSNSSGAIKKNGTSAGRWWLRAAHSFNSTDFIIVSSAGDWSTGTFAIGSSGLAPAFRIG